MEGISPRTSGQISNAPGRRHERTLHQQSWCANELESGLKHHALITVGAAQALPRAARRRPPRVPAVVKTRCSGRSPRTRPDIGLAPIRRNVKAYTPKERVRTLHRPGRGAGRRLMRSIEDKIDIPRAAGDFSREIITTSAARARGQALRLSHERAAAQSHRLKLFEDRRTRSSKKPGTRSSPGYEEKIRHRQGPAVRNYGYCDSCAPGRAPLRRQASSRAATSRSGSGRG